MLTEMVLLDLAFAYSDEISRIHLRRSNGYHNKIDTTGMDSLSNL